MSEAMRKARSKVHELYQEDKLDFWTMCTLFDTLNDVEEEIGSEL